MTLIKVLPPSAKVPGEAARAGEASDARHRAKRESGGNMMKTRHPSRGEHEEGEELVRRERVDNYAERDPAFT